MHNRQRHTPSHRMIPFDADPRSLTGRQIDQARAEVGGVKLVIRQIRPRHEWPPLLGPLNRRIDDLNAEEYRRQRGW